MLPFRCYCPLLSTFFMPVKINSARWTMTPTAFDVCYSQIPCHHSSKILLHVCCPLRFVTRSYQNLYACQNFCLGCKIRGLHSITFYCVNRFATLCSASYREFDNPSMVISGPWSYRRRAPLMGEVYGVVIAL